jgi:hypothetical protein
VTNGNAAEQPKPPPPPPEAVPDMRETNPAVFCVGCDEPFDTATHKEVLAGLVNSPYIAQLRKALYFQDIVHQVESRAHFDNCDFDGATSYITALLDEIGKEIKDAELAGSGPDAARPAVTRAFFALGQALHGVQDFYAHSNYVELQAPKVKKVTDLEILAPWRADGRDRIAALRKEGLISGFVFWGFPQKCTSGSVSHGELAKDSAETKSGRRLVAHLQNLSQYRIAVYLAREASQDLVRECFNRWPLLKEANGPNVAFEVLVDHRF